MITLIWDGLAEQGQTPACQYEDGYRNSSWRRAGVAPSHESGKMQPRHTFSLRKKLGLGLQGCIQPDINVTTWCLPLSIVQCLIQIIGGFERCLAY